MPMQKLKAEVLLKYKSPNKLLIKTTIPGKKSVVQGYNGRVGWKTSYDAKPALITGAELDSLRLNVGLEAIHNNWYELFKEIKLGKSYEKVGAYDCYELLCYPKEEYHTNIPVTLYVDNKNYLIRKMKLSVFTPAGPIVETIIVDKYKRIDNVLISAETKTSILGSEMFFSTNSVKFNEEMPDTIFDFPTEE